MRIEGLQNKFEIFQDFYYAINGVKITYNDAVRLFYNMDEATQIGFLQYCVDKVEYEVIDGGANPYITGPSGYDLDFNDRNLIKANKQLLAAKYSVEAYAAKNGLKLDSVWGQYSAEEIVSMSENGVVIPKEIVDIAHTILQSDTANLEGVRGESEEGEGKDSEKSDHEIFLELIPKAKKHIDKCHDKEAKIDEKITDLVRDNGGIQKNFEERMKKQKDTLKEYEQMIREWRVLQNKINNGEELTDTEARKYAQITGMLEDRNGSAADFKLDKLSIARSLNEINILAVLGEQLADETIEIGNQLADYVSEAKYKSTREQLTGETGFLRAIIAMLNGKTLAKEANEVGLETKEYTDETADSIKDIAGLLGVEKMIVSPVTQPEEGKSEDVKVVEEKNEAEGTEPQENLSPVENEKETLEAAEQKNTTIEDDFIVNDKNVLALIDEASKINSDLLKQISQALSDTKAANEDKNFADAAQKIVSEIIENYKKEEERRQQEISEKEAENQKAQEKIEELGGGEDENEETINGINVKGIAGEEPENEHQEEINEQQKIIDQNNIDIEALNEESAAEKEKVKNETRSYKERVNKTLPDEMKALENDTLYKDEIIPQDKERLSFTLSNGKTLFKMGTYRVTVGLEQIARWQFKKGFRNIEKGTVSQGIGMEAAMVSTTPIPKVAEKTTGNATETEDAAIESLTNLDNTIIEITEEKAAGESVTDEDEDGENSNGEDGAESTETTEDGAENAEAPAASGSDATGDGASASRVAVPVESTPAGETVPAEDPALIEEPASEDTEAAPTVPNNNPSNGGGKEMSEEEQAEAAGDMAEKEEKNQKKQTDKQEDKVKDTNKSAKDDAKESKKIEKDEKKSAKQLEKEAKKIEQDIKKEEQDLIKMVKESEEAAKKQEELLVRYEKLTLENEAIALEEEQKKSVAPAAPASQAENAQGGNGMAGATNSFGMTDSSKNSSSDNLEKLNANNQEITVLSAEFGIAGNKITRNRTKILKIEKHIKTSTKKFEKKTKLKQKKIKDQQKKEMKKQKKLQKQLAIVGIAENVFSITSTTGMVLTQIGTPMIPTGQAFIAAGEALLCWPTTALGIALITKGTILEVNGTTLTTVGGVLSTIGLYGTLACGVTKAAINIANGNLTAGLMALGQTAVAAVASATGTGAAANSTLGMVSQGLSVVSNTAQLVNNVRVVSGKEANGFMSKVGTVAGVGSALTGAASTISDLGKNGASTFNQASQIVGVAGTVASSASQLMSEFGWGDESTANILGAVGGAMGMIGSIGQLASNKKGNMEDKNKENTAEAQQNADANSNTSNSNNQSKNVENVKKAMQDKKIMAIADRASAEMGVSPEDFHKNLNEWVANNSASAQSQQSPQNSAENPATSETPAVSATAATPAVSDKPAADPNATQNAKPADEVKKIEAPELEKTADNTTTTETKTDAENNAKAEKTKAQKREEKLQKQEERRQAKEDVSAHESLVDKQKAEAKGLKGDERKNVIENGASAEFANVDDAALKEKIATAKANGASEAEINKLMDEQKHRTEFKASAQKAKDGKAKLDDYREQKFNKIGKVVEIAGKTTSATVSIMSLFASKENTGAGKKIKNKGSYDSRYLKASKYLATSSSNDNYFGGGHNDDQKRRFKRFAKRI